MLLPEKVFSWSNWQPLKNCWTNGYLPAVSGLYRIRRISRNDLDYIGQTGTGKMNLSKRLAMLKDIYKKEMPYSDPHTVGPALWALLDQSHCQFEVSFLPIHESNIYRKGLETLAIALYRQQHQASPNFNFSRMPIGYIKSSGNTKQLCEAGKRFRGGRVNQRTHHHNPSIPPTGSLSQSPCHPYWCGHQWSPWYPLSSVQNYLNVNEVGVYRIRIVNEPTLLYIGEGKIRLRLQAHYRKVQKQEVNWVFDMPLECSWVSNDSWHKNQREELENDLIASHLLITEMITTLQFRGSRAC